MMVGSAGGGAGASSSSSHQEVLEMSAGIDTANYTDIRQQRQQLDSGSNQSGSDSGLGYTNSISSSDTPTAVATKQTTFIATNNRESINRDSNNNSGSNKTNNKWNIEQAPPLCPKNDLGPTNETRIVSDKAGKHAFFKSKTNVGNNEDIHRVCENQVVSDAIRNELDAVVVVTPTTSAAATLILSSSSSPTSTATPPLPPLPLPQPPTLAQPRVPIKSLLKKSTDRPNGATSKNKRHVSFNQTVIVFCEEIDAPSPNEQFEPPPIDYQDSLSSFEPPEDFCDDYKVDGKEESSSAKLNEDLMNRAVIGDGTSNLTDNQLLDLLENESLLNTFKLNCDDLSEEDFHINYLNSDHSYLCNDAISDYDTDSESSLSIERKNFATPKSVTKPQSTSLELEPTDAGKLENHEKTKPSNLPADPKVEFVEVSREHKPIDRSNVSKTNLQKSMPARMKVSTVDSRHTKRAIKSKEDYNLKQKIESEPKSCVDHQLKLGHTEPMLIKQSNVEPVVISKKPLITKNTFPDKDQAPINNINLDSRPLQTPHTSLTSKPAELSNPSQQRLITQLPQQKLPQASHQTPNVSSSQNVLPSCQICKVIESNKSHVPCEADNNNIMEAGTSKVSTTRNDFNLHCNLVAQPNQTTQMNKPTTSQPPVFNESCASCREASLKHNAAKITTSGVAQPTRPVAYQLVYLVDQKGNRVRALSVVRPTPRNLIPAGQQPMAGTRILIAQNGLRFPNPASMVGSIVNPQSSQVVHSQVAQNFTIPGIPQQFRLVRTLQPRIVLNTVGQINNATAHLNPQGEPIGLRQHTVYYVRQPLEAQSIRQSFDSTGSSSRSFPDPHEIRRLDGLRGPTAALNLSHRDPTKLADPYQETINIMQPKNVVHKPSDSVPREDMDDPTFGFSKRPSVKVVASSSNLPLSSSDIFKQDNQSNGQTMLRERFLDNGIANVRRVAPNPSVTRPGSMFVVESQTLDRRDPHQHNTDSRDNVPRASSSSNIHGTDCQNIVSFNLSQQQRISSGPNFFDTPQENLKFRESELKSNESFNLVRSEGHKRVIVNASRVAPLIAHGRQISNLTNQKDVSSLDQNHRKVSEKSEVAYSLNI